MLDVTLRPCVLFHNGDPLSSADFEFADNRLRDPKQSCWSHLQASVESCEVIDDRRFRIRFKEPDASCLIDNLQLWAPPKRYTEQVGIDGFGRAPVGIGPWKFVSWAVKDEPKLEAFDGYWDTAHRPGVKNLSIKFIPEDLTRIAAYKTGAIDWMDAVPPSMVEAFRKLPDTRTASLVISNNIHLNFVIHLPNSPFRDDCAT